MVETEIDALRGIGDQGQQRVQQVGRPDEFEVRQVQGRPRAFGNAHKLPDGVEHSGPLVADVRHKRDALVRGDLGQGGQFARIGVQAWCVDEPERKHPGSGPEARRHLILHSPQLSAVRVALGGPEDDLPHG